MYSKSSHTPGPQLLMYLFIAGFQGYILQVQTKPDGKLPFYCTAQGPTVPDSQSTLSFYQGFFSVHSFNLQLYS